MKLSALGLASLLVSGCGVDPLSGAESAACSAARMSVSGRCCPAWTTGPDCAPRSWTRQAVSSTALSPTVAVAGNGEVVLAWERPVAPLKAAALVASENDGFAPRSPGAPLEGSVSDVHLAVGDEGTWAMIWRRTVNGQASIEASTRARGGGWRDETTPLSLPPDGAEPSVAVGPGGEVLCAWNQWTGMQYGVSIADRPPERSAFTRPKQPNDVISPLIEFTNDPEIAINARGDALISWYQSVGAKLRTYVSERRGTDGAFSRPGPSDALSPPGADVEDPKVVLADDGTAVVAWRQEVSETQSAVFMATRDAQGAWTRPADLTDGLTVPADEVWDVKVAFTDRGDLIVVWEEEQGEDIAILAAHRDPSGVWRIPGTSPLRLSSPTPSIDPVLAVGLDGHLVVAWTELEGEDWKVVARRASTDGNGLAWTEREEVSEPGKGRAGQVAAAMGGPLGRVALAFIQNDDLVLATY